MWGSAMASHARLIGAALGMMAASPAAATDAAVQACFDKMTGGEQKLCMAAVQRAAKAELGFVYHDALAAARKLDSSSSSPAFAIETSEKAWEAYRDAECGGVVRGGAWSSGTAVMVMGCYAEKTYERIRELKAPFYQR